MQARISGGTLAITAVVDLPLRVTTILVAKSDDYCDGKREVGKSKTGKQARFLFSLKSLYQSDHRDDLHGSVRSSGASIGVIRV